MSQETMRRTCWTLLAVTWVGIAVNVLYAVGPRVRLPQPSSLVVLIATFVSVVGPQVAFAYSQTQPGSRQAVPLRGSIGSDGWSAVLMNTVMICVIPAVAYALVSSPLWMFTAPLSMMSALLLYIRQRQLRQLITGSASSALT